MVTAVGAGPDGRMAGTEAWSVIESGRRLRAAAKAFGTERVSGADRGRGRAWAGAPGRGAAPWNGDR